MIVEPNHDGETNQDLHNGRFIRGTFRWLYSCCWMYGVLFHWFSQPGLDSPLMHISQLEVFFLTSIPTLFLRFRSTQHPEPSAQWSPFYPRFWFQSFTKHCSVFSAHQRGWERYVDNLAIKLRTSSSVNFHNHQSCCNAPHFVPFDTFHFHVLPCASSILLTEFQPACSHDTQQTIVRSYRSKTCLLWPLTSEWSDQMTYPC